MKRIVCLLTAVFMLAGVTWLFCKEESTLIHPRLSGDFKDGKPVLSIAPGEKRLSRTWGEVAHQGYRRHPYDSFPGRRISLMDHTEWDAQGNAIMVPMSNMSAAVLGAMNLAEGTLVGWFRKGDIFHEAGGWLLTVKNFESILTGHGRGDVYWGLGIGSDESNGHNIHVYTPFSYCVTKNIRFPNHEWLHIGVVWDENAGVKIYLNGELVGESVTALKTSTVDNPIPTSRMQIHADAKGGIRDLQIFDTALKPEGVKALFQGKLPHKQMAESSRSSPSSRLASLGWDSAPETAFLKVVSGHPLFLQQAWILEAREDLRAAGWLAVSGFVHDTFPWPYHGYSQIGDRTLRLEFGDGIIPNWMVGNGNFRGLIQNSQGEPLPFQTSGPWFGQAIDMDAQGEEMVFTHRSGSLSNLSFYEVLENGMDFPNGGETYWLREATGTVPLPKWKEKEFYSVYTPANRLVLEAQTLETPQAIQRIPALAAWHIVSSPMDEDYYLGEIGLRFRTSELSEKTRARITIHDPFSPWREISRLDFMFEPSRTGDPEFALLLDIRDRLLARGDVVWVTVTFDREVELKTGAEGTELVLFPAECEERTLALWKEWELRTVRDRFETISEPRPWGQVGEDEDSRWWLGVTTPIYEQLDRSLSMLMERFPGDPTVQAWYYFTHPRAEAPVSEVPLPESDGHPEWAVLTRECLRLYRQFVDFWIDQRQHPKGEFGNNFNDDSVLVQDWLDMIMISDPDGKYQESLDRLARGIHTFMQLGGRDGPGGERIRGGPLMVNGLNLRWLDVLHAYEDGLNIQPPDFIASYGDPDKFQYLLDTISRYDGFLLTEEIEGRRRFASEGTGTPYLNTYNLRGDPDNSQWYLLLHAGLVAAWYNNDPDIWSMLVALAEWELIASRTRSAAGGWLLQAVFSKTGDMRYLFPLIDVDPWVQNRTLSLPGNALYPNTYFRAPEFNKEQTFESSVQSASTRYSMLGSHMLGWSDHRHLENWLEWRLSGDEEHLLEGLRALYRQLVFLMPAYTIAEQSGDRVAIPKQLVSQLYLGGIPGSRNRHFYPDFAVSYRGLDDNFAARVLENTKQTLQIELYSFHDRPVSGEVLVWTLEAGVYSITQGTGNQFTTTRKFLKRGESFPITLPPFTTWLVSIEQESPAEEPLLMGDAALSAKNITWENGTLRVPVYNLGVKPLTDVAVRLLSKNGGLIEEKHVGMLPGLSNWKLGEAEALFKIKPQEPMIVEVVLKNGGQEITTRNNQVVFSF